MERVCNQQRYPIYLAFARILQTVDVISPSDLNYSLALVELTHGYTTNVKARNKIIQILMILHGLFRVLFRPWVVFAFVKEVISTRLGMASPSPAGHHFRTDGAAPGALASHPCLPQPGLELGELGPLLPPEVVAQHNLGVRWWSIYSRSSEEANKTESNIKIGRLTTCNVQVPPAVQWTGRGMSVSVRCLAWGQTVARCLAMSSVGVARSQEGQGSMAGRDIRPDWAWQDTLYCTVISYCSY